ncbi:MAG: hypothetical protein K2X35_24475 [Bryobacteraceae bacterium]|nr:hypothetical protein [Bryobacteraceae bacterium]
MMFHYRGKFLPAFRVSMTIRVRRQHDQVRLRQNVSFQIAKELAAFVPHPGKPTCGAQRLYAKPAVDLGCEPPDERGKEGFMKRVFAEQKDLTHPDRPA